MVTRSTGTPLFGLRGTISPTFRDEKVKNLLSSVVNIGDLIYLLFIYLIHQAKGTVMELGSISLLSVLLHHGIVCLLTLTLIP